MKRSISNLSWYQCPVFSPKFSFIISNLKLFHKLPTVTHLFLNSQPCFDRQTQVVQTDASPKDKDQTSPEKMPYHRYWDGCLCKGDQVEIGGGKILYFFKSFQVRQFLLYVSFFKADEMIQPGGRSNLWQTYLTSGWKVSLWVESRTEGCVLCWDENVVDQNFVAWLCLHKILQSLSFFSPVQEAILQNHCPWFLCVKEDGSGPWSLVLGLWLLCVKEDGGGGAVGAVLGQEGWAAKWRTREEVCVLKVSASWWIS